MKNSSHLPELLPARFNLHNAKKWPKTTSFHFILLLLLLKSDLQRFVVQEVCIKQVAPLQCSLLFR